MTTIQPSMKKFGALLVTAGILVFTPTDQLHSKEIKHTQEQLEVYEKIDEQKAKHANGELDQQQMCDNIWSLLWPQAKSDPHFKAYLFYLVNPFKFAFDAPDFPVMRLPGRTGDILSQSRDMVILGMSLLSTNPEKDGLNSYNHEPIKLQLKRTAWGRTFGTKFFECLEKEETQECIKDAVVTRKEVPSFEEFTREIEALEAQGFKAHCVNFN